MEELVIKKLTFNKQPIPIPADYRPLYKIGLVVLILHTSCWADTSDLLKLHLMSWAVSSDANMRKLREYITSNFKTELSIWGIEPALNRALQYAVAENICEIVYGKKYKLTEKGLRFYRMIDSDSELLKKEKEFFRFIGKKTLTDTRIKEMSKEWTDVKN